MSADVTTVTPATSAWLTAHCPQSAIPDRDPTVADCDALLEKIRVHRGRIDAVAAARHATGFFPTLEADLVAANETTRLGRLMWWRHTR